MASVQVSLYLKSTISVICKLLLYFYDEGATVAMKCICQRKNGCIATVAMKCICQSPSYLKMSATPEMLLRVEHVIGRLAKYEII